MYNIKLKAPFDPPQDLPTVWSAIFVNNEIKLNCFKEPEKNPYTFSQIMDRLDLNEKISYVNPPLEAYLTYFRPMLNKMVEKAYPTYQKLIQDKQDLLSILFLTIVKLYNKNYYLHNYLIYKSFINELNMEIRHTKAFTDCISLDEPTSNGDEQEPMTLKDMLIDESESEIAYNLSHYTQDDYKQELFNKIKQAMLQEMSPFEFERILIQLKSKTIDTRTSRILSKYRAIFNIAERS